MGLAAQATEIDSAFGGVKAATICGLAEKEAQDHYWLTTTEDNMQTASPKSGPADQWIWRN